MTHRGLLHSEFTSYLRLFLTLALTVIVLTGGVQYAYSYQMMERLSLDSSHSTLLLLANSHEMILSQVEETIGSLVNNTYLLDYMDYFKGNMHNTCLSIIEQLDSATDGNAYIDSVCVYYREAGYTLSSDYGPAGLEWYYDAEFLKTLDSMDWRGKRVLNRTVMNHRSANAAERHVLTFVCTLPAFYTSALPKAYIVINLDEDAITSSLRFLSDRGEVSLLVVDEYGNRIAALDADEAAERALFGVDTGAEGEIVTSRISVDGRELLAQSMRTGHGWIYHIAQPVSVVMGGISRMQNMFLIVCSVALISSIVLSLLFSRRVFEPIRAISDRFTEVFGGDGSLYGYKAERVIGRIDAIIARNTQLENERRRIELDSRDLWFLRLAQGAVEREKRAETAGMLGISPAQGREMTLFISDGGHVEREARTGVVSEALSSLGMEALYAVTGEDELTVVLAGYRADGEHDTAYRAALALARALGGERRLTVGVSRPFSDGAGLNEAYHQALKALEMRMVRGEGGIYEAAGAPSVPYPSAIESDLLRALKNRDPEAARAALNAFGLYFVQNGLSAEETAAYYYELQKVVLCLKEELLGMPEKPGGAPRADAPADAHAALEGICRELIGLLRPMENAPYSPLVKNLCAYIDANLSEDLSLKALSAKFFASTSNLRKNFHDDTGLTIKEYVDGRRFIAAKRMLTEDDLQIQEIARQLGFCYAQSFIAFFKQMEGVTPGEYRGRR